MLITYVMRLRTISESIEDINSHLTVALFSKLPILYQTAVIIRAFEVNDDVPWSHKFDVRKFDWTKESKELKDLIGDYAAKYPNRKFGYGVVPINLICDQVMKGLKELGDQPKDATFDDYHKEYGDPGENHKEVLPILIDEKEIEFIEDGWHRFHNYYDQGKKEIPVVKFL